MLALMHEQGRYEHMRSDHEIWGHVNEQEQGNVGGQRSSQN